MLKSGRVFGRDQSRTERKRDAVINRRHLERDAELRHFDLRVQAAGSRLDPPVRLVAGPNQGERLIGLDEHDVFDGADRLVLVELAKSVEVSRARRQNFDDQLGKRRLGPVRIARAAIDPDVGAANLARTRLDAPLPGERAAGTASEPRTQLRDEVTTISSWTFFAPALISSGWPFTSS